MGPPTLLPDVSRDTDLDDGVASTPTKRDGAPSDDLLFDLLSSRRRRRVLSALLETEGEVSLDALAARVAARAEEASHEEEEASPEAVSESEREGYRVSLHHVHLPRLDDAGVVAYDRDDRTVRLADGTDRLAEFL